MKNLKRLGFAAFLMMAGATVMTAQDKVNFSISRRGEPVCLAWNKMWRGKFPAYFGSCLQRILAFCLGKH